VLRWVEGVALAGILGLAGFITVHWIYDAPGTPSIPPRLLLTLLLSAPLGFLFGATIPTGYRNTT
jgi:hypothetical protein